MSERSDGLKAAIGKALDEAWVNEFDDEADDDRVMVARAICEHLGLTWETHDRCGTNQTARDIFATLLEAGGVER